MATGHQGNTDSVILQEEIDPNYEPKDSEIIDYAKWLGMNLEEDKHLLWIAKEGLKAPLPGDWKPCRTTDTNEIYYFNFTTGESTWDHPCDDFYRNTYEEEKRKERIKLGGPNTNSNDRSNEMEVVKKITKKQTRQVAGPTPAIQSNLNKAPLPGIKPTSHPGDSLGAGLAPIDHQRLSNRFLDPQIAQNKNSQPPESLTNDFASESNISHTRNRRQTVRLQPQDTQILEDTNESTKSGLFPVPDMSNSNRGQKSKRGLPNMTTMDHHDNLSERRISSKLQQPRGQPGSPFASQYHVNPTTADAEGKRSAGTGRNPHDEHILHQEHSHYDDQLDDLKAQIQHEKTALLRKHENELQSQRNNFRRQLEEEEHRWNRKLSELEEEHHNTMTREVQHHDRKMSNLKQDFEAKESRERFALQERFNNNIESFRLELEQRKEDIKRQQSQAESKYNQSLNDERNAIQRELNRIRGEMEQERNVHAERIQSLREEEVQMKQQLRKQEETMQSLTTSIQVKMDQVRQLEDDYARVKEQLSKDSGEESVSLNDKAASRVSAFTAMKDVGCTVEIEGDDKLELREELFSYKAELKQLNAKYEKLTEHNTNMDNDHSKALLLIENLQTQLRVSEQARDVLTKDLERAVDDYSRPSDREGITAALNKKLAEKEIEVKNLNQKLQDKQDEISNLASSLDLFNDKKQKYDTKRYDSDDGAVSVKEHSQLQQELEFLETKYSRLKELYETTKSKYEDTLDDLKDTEKQVASAEQELHSGEQNLKLANQQLKKKEEKIESLMKDLEEQGGICRNFSSRSNELRNENEKLNGLCSQKQSDIEEASSKIETLHGELESAQAHNAAVEGKLRNQQEELEKVHIDLKTLSEALQVSKSHFQESEQKCEALQAKLSSLESEKLALQEQLNCDVHEHDSVAASQNLRKENTELKMQLNRLQQENSRGQYSEILEELNPSIQMTHQVNILEAKLAQREERLDASLSRQRELESQAEQYVQEVDKLSFEVNTLKHEKERLKSRIENLQGRNSELKSEADSLSKSRQTLFDEKLQLEQQSEMLERKIRENEGTHHVESARAQAIENNLNSEIEELNLKIHNLEKEIDGNLEKSNAEAEERIRILEDKVIDQDSITSELWDANKKVEALTQECSTWKTQSEILQTEADEIKAECAKLTELLSAADERAKKAEKQLTNISNDAEVNEVSIQSTTRQISSLEAELQEARDQVVELSRELEETKSHLLSRLGKKNRSVSKQMESGTEQHDDTGNDNDLNGELHETEGDTNQKSKPSSKSKFSAPRDKREKESRTHGSDKGSDEESDSISGSGGGKPPSQNGHLSTDDGHDTDGTTTDSDDRPLFSSDTDSSTPSQHSHTKLSKLIRKHIRRGHRLKDRAKAEKVLCKDAARHLSLAKRAIGQREQFISKVCNFVEHMAEKLPGSTDRPNSPHSRQSKSFRSSKSRRKRVSENISSDVVVDAMTATLSKVSVESHSERKKIKRQEATLSRRYELTRRLLRTAEEILSYTSTPSTSSDSSTGSRDRQSTRSLRVREQVLSQLCVRANKIVAALDSDVPSDTGSASSPEPATPPAYSYPQVPVPQPPVVYVPVPSMEQPMMPDGLRMLHAPAWTSTQGIGVPLAHTSHGAEGVLQGNPFRSSKHFGGQEHLFSSDHQKAGSRGVSSLYEQLSNDHSRAASAVASHNRWLMGFRDEMRTYCRDKENVRRNHADSIALANEMMMLGASKMVPEALLRGIPPESFGLSGPKGMLRSRMESLYSSRWDKPASIGGFVNEESTNVLPATALDSDTKPAVNPGSMDFTELDVERE